MSHNYTVLQLFPDYDCLVICRAQWN